MNITATETGFATLTAPDTVRFERLLPGPIERVWAYLTDSDLRRRWLAAGDMQAQAGTPFELVWRNDELTDPPGTRPEGFGQEHRMQSTITVFEPPHRLAFTWNGSGDVSIDLQPQGDEVRLTLIHRQLPDRSTMRKVGAGWHTHLDLLVARVSGESVVEPFWDGWSQLREAYDRRLPA
ncbi:SRPBCC family protein [Montanilutibacter psychrotolerans]|uniref:SRPBCC family protein n=1 Tax=Montanilutibacter psychrotolerans TaxID=1327343 RepID=A0A3M8SUX0_9GAMM|nr:SRPBCC family protein [Lysobacter psychrotolerans]RNF85099.1 SRPBCC family protein [Lysobacter psychrotolerans]